MLDKDALAHLIDEYPNMRDTVRGALTTFRRWSAGCNLPDVRCMNRVYAAQVREGVPAVNAARGEAKGPAARGPDRHAIRRQHDGAFHRLDTVACGWTLLGAFSRPLLDLFVDNVRPPGTGD